MESLVRRNYAQGQVPEAWSSAALEVVVKRKTYHIIPSAVVSLLASAAERRDLHPDLWIHGPPAAHRYRRRGSSEQAIGRHVGGLVSFPALPLWSSRELPVGVCTGVQLKMGPGLRRGYNIGIRLIDEFLAKSKISKCIDFRDSAEKLAKVLQAMNVCALTPSRLSHDHLWLLSGWL